MKKQAIEGLRTRKTANGTRYLLAVKRPDGKEIMQTVPVTPKDSDATIRRKCEAVRAELMARIAAETAQPAVAAEPVKRATVTATMAEEIDRYIQRRLRPRSAEILRRALAGFTLEDEDANAEALDALLEREDIKDSSKRTMVAYVKAFYAWRRECGSLVRNPVADVKLPPKGAPRRRLPTDEETARIIAIAQRLEAHKVGSRGETLKIDHTGLELFCRLMITTGARVSTIRAIHVGDLDRNGLLTLYNVKTQKRYDVRLPVTDPQIPVLWRELASNRPAEDLLFFSEDYGMQLTKCLQGRLREFGTDDNGETLTPHSFRHGVASRMLQAGVPIETISKVLDHASIATTLATYARHNDAQIADAFAAIK